MESLRSTVTPPRVTGTNQSGNGSSTGAGSTPPVEAQANQNEPQLIHIPQNSFTHSRGLVQPNDTYRSQMNKFFQLTSQVQSQVCNLNRWSCYNSVFLFRLLSTTRTV